MKTCLLRLLDQSFFSVVNPDVSDLRLSHLLMWVKTVCTLEMVEMTGNETLG